MAKNRDKKKRRWWLTVIIVATVFVAALGIYKIKSSRTDADLILTISEQGFEGHFYDAGERDKAVITFSGSRAVPAPVIPWPGTISSMAYLRWV